jgi:iron(III) transport system permease protein
MVLAYMVRRLPFSVRSSSAILHQIDPSLEEASINLGVPPLKTFLRITVPLMLGGIVGGLVLTFVTVASELSATVVLYSGPWTTMTVAMFQALEGDEPRRCLGGRDRADPVHDPSRRSRLSAPAAL